MAYEYKESDLLDLISRQGWETTPKSKEIQFKWCPFCNGGGHDKYTFSINRESGVYNCLRSSCGAKGHFVRLAKEFDYAIDFGDNTPSREYDQYTKADYIPDDETVAKFGKSRGISSEICKKYYIRSADARTVIFQHIDDTNTLQTIKYRLIDYVKGRDKAKEWFKPNTKPILFGMYQCDIGQSDVLYITEGQIDALSLAECGIINATSVPGGCKSFKWFPHCFTWLKQFKKIVVFGDNEHGKITLVSEIAERLKNTDVVVCYIRPESYQGCKDANEILCTYGAAELYNVAQEYIPFNNQLFLSIDDVGFEEVKSWRIKTGFPSLDRALKGIGGGQLGIISGKTGEGKSTFLSMLMVEAVKQDKKVLLYSGELNSIRLLNTVTKQLTGAAGILLQYDENGFEEYYITKDAQAYARKKFGSHLYFINNGAIDGSFGNDLDKIKSGVKQIDVNVICVDNVMTAIPSTATINQDQTEFVKALKAMATELDVLVLLVAHMKKTDDMTNDSISGASEITKLSDFTLFYSREVDEYSRVRLTKNRDEGTLIEKGMRVRFDYKTKRIVEAKNE